MYKKKIVEILLAIVLISALTGCSAARRGRTGKTAADTAAAGLYLYSDIIGNNISEWGFFISKARVEIITDGSRDRFTASLRKSSDGKWLASIRSFAGIEVVRAYADREHVVILDRLGRTATVLNWSEMKSNYGLSYDLLPVLVGDLPEMRNQSRIRLRCDSMSDFSAGTLFVTMLTDCSRMRPATMILRDTGNGREITVQTEQYSSVGGVDYSSVIEVRERSGLFHVKMNIDNLELPWKGEVEFSIPSNYRRNR
jgi:hypothetical protein